MAEPIMCPECGWTGTEDALDADQQCPVCDTNVGFVD